MSQADRRIKIKRQLFGLPFFMVTVSLLSDRFVVRVHVAIKLVLDHL